MEQATQSSRAEPSPLVQKLLLPMAVLSFVCWLAFSQSIRQAIYTIERALAVFGF